MPKEFRREEARRPPNRLKNQDPVAWIVMSKQTLSGAFQIAKDRRELLLEKADARCSDLFLQIVDVRGCPDAGRSAEEQYLDKFTWHEGLGWSETMLVALSAEQSLKSIAILRSGDSGCLKTHDLTHLLQEIGDGDQDGIIATLADAKERTRAVHELGRQNLRRPRTKEHLRIIVDAHRDLFNKTRYRFERDLDRRLPGFRRDFWHVALALLLYANRLVVAAKRKGGLTVAP